MIARKFRFHGYGSLNYVYRSGQSVRGTLCSIKFVKNERRNRFRVAVVVSKKVHKSAVARNRVRRRIYEIIRANQESITEPYDIVVSVFSDQVAGLSDQELTKLIRGNLSKAKII